MRLYQKSSGLWAVDYVTDAGERRRVSCGTRDKAVARAKAREIIMGIAQPGDTPVVALNTPGKVEGMTMDALFRQCELTCWSPRECRSQRTVKSNLKLLSAIMGRELVADVRQSRLEALVVDLRGRGYAEGTIKRKMDMVGRALSEAEKLGMIPARPRMPTVKSGASRTRVLSDVEEVAVFAAIDTRMQGEPTRDWRRVGALFRFLLDTGCRLGEALQLRRHWIERLDRPGEDEAFFVVRIPAWATKTHKARAVPLTPRVLADLQYLEMVAGRAQAGAEPGALLFPLSPATAWYHWNNIRDDLAAKGMDLSDVVLHSFRHTCLTRLAKRMPIHMVSKWAGHASIKITAEVYAHLDAEDLLSGVAILARTG